MLDREVLMEWVVEAINANRGHATIIEVCKHVWQNHENEIRQSGDSFYTWQYDIRWAGQKLLDEGVLKPTTSSPKGIWEIK